jgi:hypothetical protein
MGGPRLMRSGRAGDALRGPALLQRLRRPGEGRSRQTARSGTYFKQEQSRVARVHARSGKQPGEPMENDARAVAAALAEFFAER